MGRFALFVSGSFFMALIAPVRSDAAEFYFLSTEPIHISEIVSGRCTIELRGRIQEGDAAKLESLLLSDEFEGGMPTWLALDASPQGEKIISHALCLDSPGGDLSEALKIARTLDYPTVVRRDAQCLSACAFLFLSGSLTSSNSSGGARIPFRVLDIEGQLGFHAPFPEVSRIPDGLPRSAIPDFVNQFYSTGLNTIGAIDESIERMDSYRVTDRLPRALLLKILETRGAENFFYIDTIHKAGLIDIRLSGVPNLAIGADSYGRMCSNAMLWDFGSLDTGFEPDTNSWAYHSIYPKDEGEFDTTTVPPMLLLHQGSGGIWSEEPMPDFSVQVVSRHYICTFYSHPGAVDDFSLYYRNGEGSSPVMFRSLEPWQSLPHYVTFDELADSGDNFDTDAIVTRYQSADDDGTAQKFRFDGFRRGWTAVLHNSDYEASGTIAVYLEPTMDGRVYFEDGRTITLTGDAEGHSGCFRLDGQPEERRCFSYSTGEYEENLVSLSGVFDDYIVEFSRPGDIGGLTEWRKY
jgi:hypothetical protein